MPQEIFKNTSTQYFPWLEIPCNVFLSHSEKRPAAPGLELFFLAWETWWRRRGFSGCRGRDYRGRYMCARTVLSFVGIDDVQRLVQTKSAKTVSQPGGQGPLLGGLLKSLLPVLFVYKLNLDLCSHLSGLCSIIGKHTLKFDRPAPDLTVTLSTPRVF